MNRLALFSPDGLYRYVLYRGWGEGRQILWIMLNPSTADARHDDPTIRRVIGFSQDWGYGRAVIVNLYAWRATDPRELVLAGTDATGTENDEHIRDWAATSWTLMAAWGAHAMATTRGDAVSRMLGRNLYCLGRTRLGAPLHPLYVPRVAQPVRFRTYDDGLERLTGPSPADAGAHDLGDASQQPSSAS